MGVRFTNDPAGMDVGDLCADPERASKMRKYLEDIDEYRPRLSDKQFGFVEDMRDKLERDGPAAQFTDRQYGFLKGLWEKL